MSDIVSRLRHGWPADEILSKDMPRVRADAIEAADRIADLEAQVLRVTAERDEVNKQIVALLNYADECDEVYQKMLRQSSALVSDRDALRTQLAAAHEALEPFARFIAARDAFGVNKKDTTIAAIALDASITYGDLRRARAVIDSKGGE